MVQDKCLKIALPSFFWRNLYTASLDQLIIIIFIDNLMSPHDNSKGIANLFPTN